MAQITVKKISMSDFLHFASEIEPLQLVDIETSPRNGADSYVYQTTYFIDENWAKSHSIESVKFSVFTSDPAKTKEAKSIADFLVQIDTKTDEKQKDVRSLLISTAITPSTAFSNIKNMTITSIAQPTAVSPFKIAAKNAEIIQKIDPAFVLSAGKYLGTTPAKANTFGIRNAAPAQEVKNFERLSSRQEPVQSVRNNREQIATSKVSQASQMINDFLNLKKIVVPESLTKNMPVVSTDIEFKKTEYTRQFVIDKEKIGGVSKLFLAIEAKTKIVNAVVASRTFIINHEAEVSDFLSNPEPPEVLVIAVNAHSVNLSLTRKDKTLKQMSVVRIIKNNNTGNVSIQTISNLTYRDSDTIIFHDTVDNIVPNTIIYRFMSKNDNGTCGSFSSYIAPAYVKVSDAKKMRTTTTPISIFAINRERDIQISIDVMSDDIFTLRLLRQDFSKTGTMSDVTSTIRTQSDEYLEKIGGKRTTLRFIDTNVVQGHHYRYFAAYRGMPGFEETISDEDDTIVRRAPSVILPFSGAVTPAQITNDNNGIPSVSFSLITNEKNETMGTLMSALRSAGVDAKFLSDLQNDSQKAREVVAFLIERVDRITGKRVSFGVYPPGKFVDDANERRKKNLPDLIAGRKYDYVCKMCIRPSASFLLSAFAGFTASRDQPGVTTQVLAAKFQGALAARGIMPSDNTIRTGVSIEENFISGQTGIELVVSAVMPKIAFKLGPVNAKNRKYFNLLTWTVSGNTSDIGHFLVYCNYHGTDELLGVISGTGFAGSFSFKDHRYVNEVGEKKYFVKAVSHSHDILEQSPEVVQFNAASLPIDVLQKIMNVKSSVGNQNTVLPSDTRDKIGLFSRMTVRK